MHDSAAESGVITVDLGAARTSPGQACRDVPTSWARIELVRQAARDLFPDLTQQLRETVAMVASELAENVLKHGEPMPDAEAQVSLTRSGTEVTICALSGLASGARLQKLAEHLERIARSPDAHALYLERMQQIIEVPDKPGSQLGLLRIAYEGGFELSMSHVDSRLTVVAKRKLA